jgi:hypothetical protein
VDISMCRICSLFFLLFLILAGSAIVAADISKEPEWVRDLVARLQSEPLANPPASLIRFDHAGKTYYYLPPRCCDIPSTLFDSEGKVMCAPDGGITGRGDGRCPDFVRELKNGVKIWEDQRNRRRNTE